MLGAENIGNDFVLYRKFNSDTGVMTHRVARVLDRQIVEVVLSDSPLGHRWEVCEVAPEDPCDRGFVQYVGRPAGDSHGYDVPFLPEYAAHETAWREENGKQRGCAWRAAE